MFTQVIIQKRKTDGHTDVQRKTIIPHHYCGGWGGWGIKKSTPQKKKDHLATLCNSLQSRLDHHSPAVEAILPRDTPRHTVPHVPTSTIFWLFLRRYAPIWSHCSLEPPHTLGLRVTPRHVSRAHCCMPFAAPGTAQMGSAGDNPLWELFPCLGGFCNNRLRPIAMSRLATPCSGDSHEVGNILSWRLIMKYFLRSFSPFR